MAGSGNGNGGGRDGSKQRSSGIPSAVRGEMDRGKLGKAAQILKRHLDAVRRGETALQVDEELVTELLSEAVNLRGARFNGDEGRALLWLAQWLRDNNILDARDRRLLVRRANTNGHARIADVLQQGV